MGDLKKTLEEGASLEKPDEQELKSREEEKEKRRKELEKVKKAIEDDHLSATR